MKIVIKRPINWVGPYQVVDKLLFFLNEDLRIKVGDCVARGVFENMLEKIHGRS